MSPSISVGRPIMVAFVVALGIAVAWCFAVLWGMITVTQASRTQAEYEMVYVRVDGQPLILSNTRNSASGNVTQQVLTLEGEPDDTDQQLMLYPSYMGVPGGGMIRETRRLAAANDGGAPAIYWYL